MGAGPGKSETVSGATDIAVAHDFHHQHHIQPGKEAHDALYRFNNPEQIWKRRHRIVVKWLGRVGWVAKGIIYAIIGGLSCQSAVQGSAPSSNSPQGAFILLGNNPAGVPLLVVLAVGVGLYATWRFWEAITGQGTDQTFSKLKNFFKFRLSPFVSGAVYTAYMAYIIVLCFKSKQERQGGNKGDVTNKWNKSVIGKIGLALFGIAFTAATIVQLDATFRKGWHRDYKLNHINKKVKWATLVTGHVGYLGRAGVFLFTAVLFYRAISSKNSVGDNATTIGDALNQLEGNGGGRFLLFLLGLALIIYGGFAALSSYARYFPTQPPSRLARTHTLSASDAALKAREAEEERQQQLKRRHHGLQVPEALPGAVPGVVPVYGPGGNMGSRQVADVEMGHSVSNTFH